MTKAAKATFELVFFGEATVRAYKLPRYKRVHPTLESASNTAREVYEKMEADGISTAAHPGIVLGPGCGKDGTRV